jgi:hypothetical protein
MSVVEKRKPSKFFAKDLKNKGGARVTRLGDFSPIGRLFTLGLFTKITKVAQMFGLIFTTAKVM